jgi:two-component system cell cycle response regulator
MDIMNRAPQTNEEKNVVMTERPAMIEDILRKKWKALIVEDDPVSGKIIEMGAIRADFDVTVCMTGEEAWDLFEREGHYLVILDWNLAGMDGLTLSKKIRESPRGRYVAILMLTGHDRPEDLEQALKAGVTHYMVKPIRKPYLDAWLSVARKNIEDLVSLEQGDLRLKCYKEELESTNEQLEDAIARANKMALEAEQAFIELRQIFQTVPGGIAVIDRTRTIIRHNESFLNLVGITKERVGKAKCGEILQSKLCGGAECPLARIIAGEEFVTAEIDLDHEDGTKKYFHLIATPFRGPGGDLVGIIEHLTDITERVKAEYALRASEKRYRELSTVDELTKLFNKRYFNRQLQFEVDRSRRYRHPLTLLMMDIDNFKHHNDTYGHYEGDKVLARLGEMVGNCIRSSDLACRYGGEEFAVILPETIGENALIVAEKIRKTFEQIDFYPQPEERINKTLSIGVAQLDSDDDMSALIERADKNLYRAKREGRNRTVL